MVSGNEKLELRTLGQGHSCKLWRSNDDVLVIETPFSRVIYDSKTVEIENTRLTTTQLKGLCGNSNQDKRDETVSAQGCIAKTAETAALTFRVQEKSCSALSQQKKIKQQQHQQQQGKKVKTQQQQQKKTVQLTQLVQKESEECNQMKHVLVRQGKTLAFLKSLLFNVEMAVEPETSERRLFLSSVCLPIDPALPSFMKKRSAVEKSSLNLETWIKLSNLRCRFHLPVPIPDFK